MIIYVLHLCEKTAIYVEHKGVVTSDQLQKIGDMVANVQKRRWTPIF